MKTKDLAKIIYDVENKLNEKLVKGSSNTKFCDLPYWVKLRYARKALIWYTVYTKVKKK